MTSWLHIYYLPCVHWHVGYKFIIFLVCTEILATYLLSPLCALKCWLLHICYLLCVRLHAGYKFVISVVYTEMLATAPTRLSVYLFTIPHFLSPMCALTCWLRICYPPCVHWHTGYIFVISHVVHWHADAEVWRRCSDTWGWFLDDMTLPPPPKSSPRLAFNDNTLNLSSSLFLIGCLPPMWMSGAPTPLRPPTPFYTPLLVF